MARLRFNGLSSSLGASLTDSGTTITFASKLTYAGGDVPSVASPDYLVLSILDSNGKCAEVVKVTAYTSGATSATIERGQEDTPGVAHTSGASVVHGSTAGDQGWSSTIRDDLSSLTGWTVQQGTWSIVGGVLRQSDASTGGSDKRRIVRDSGVTPLPGAVRVEARFVSGSGSTQRAGIYYGWDGSSTSNGYFGAVQTDGSTAWSAYNEKDSITAGPNTDIGYDIGYGTWFALGVVRYTTGSAELFVDDIAINSWSSAPWQGSAVGLHTYAAVVEFRNLQVWGREDQLPPWGRIFT